MKCRRGYQWIVNSVRNLSDVYRIIYSLLHDRSNPLLFHHPGNRIPVHEALLSEQLGDELSSEADHGHLRVLGLQGGGIQRSDEGLREERERRRYEGARLRAEQRAHADGAAEVPPDHPQPVPIGRRFPDRHQGKCVNHPKSIFDDP